MKTFLITLALCISVAFCAGLTALYQAGSYNVAFGFRWVGRLPYAEMSTGRGWVYMFNGSPLSLHEIVRVSKEDFDARFGDLDEGNNYRTRKAGKK